VSAETTPIQKGPIDHDVLQAVRAQSVLFLSMSALGDRKAMRRECNGDRERTWSSCPHPFPHVADAHHSDLRDRAHWTAGSATLSNPRSQASCATRPR
jgi:hypothetical protein